MRPRHCKVQRLSLPWSCRPHYCWPGCTGVLCPWAQRSLLWAVSQPPPRILLRKSLLPRPVALHGVAAIPVQAPAFGLRRCPGSSGGRVPGSAAPPGLAAAGGTVRPGGTGMNPTGSRAPGSRCAHRAGLTGFSYAQSAVSTLGCDLLSCHTTAGRSLGPFSRASPHRNCGLCLGVSAQDSWPNRVDNDNKSAVLAIAERCLHTVKASSVNHSAAPSK